MQIGEFVFRESFVLLDTQKHTRRLSMSESLYERLQILPSRQYSLQKGYCCFRTG